ncbi:response regulator [Candidatus Poribacteria bacterium]|nr:response regulator [Candidatus Poribacteria bacterium]
MSGPVLICDDEAEVRTLVRLALSPLYPVAEAPDGLAAWKKFEELKPRLVVTDLGMPGMNGLDLAEKIKNHEELGQTPVIILTGATQGEELPGGFWRLGTAADHFIEKPFKPAELLCAVDRLLKQRVHYKPLPPGKGHYE